MFVLRHLIYQKKLKSGALISPKSPETVFIKDCSKNNNLFEIVLKNATKCLVTKFRKGFNKTLKKIFLPIFFKALL